MMYYSHMNFMNSIADILAEAGNDVTVFMPVIDDRYVNKTGLKFVEKVIFKRAEQDLIDIHIQMNGLNNTKAAFNQWGMTSSVISVIPLMIAAMDLPKKIAQSVFNDKSLLEKLEAEKFDLGIAEPVGLTGFALFDHIKIPVTISATSMVQFPIVADAIGEPMSASFVPGHLVAFTDEMSFLERTINIASQTMFYYFLRLLGGFELGAIEDIVGKKEWRELIGKISYSFHHSHPYIDFPRPEMPKTIPIGGITLEKSASVNMTLPEEWDEILSVRETNILISFGTYAKTSDMPDEYKKNFISLFEKFPNTTFIWKYEDPEEELFQGIDNLVLTKWMPQVPLLADPRLSLFIMHGGIGSTIEVAHSGKPAIVIPIQGDQRRNAAALRKHKVALTLHKEDLGDKDKLIDAVVEVLGDEDYQKRAKRLSELLKNRPFSAKELVLKHCNLAAKFGPLVELDSYGKNLGAIRYYLIDVVLLLIFITLLTISLISLCCVYTSEAGNDVTVFMPVIDDRYVNKTGLKFVEKVIFKRAEQDLIDIHIQMNGLNNTKAAFNQWGMTSSVISMIPLMIAAMDLPKKIAQSVFNDKSLLEKLEAEKFDLGIAEPLGLTGFALFDHIKIPVTISATSMVQLPIVADAIGEPISASFVPGHFAYFTDEMNIFERATNLLSQLAFHYGFAFMGCTELSGIEDIVGKKDWRELLSKISYSFHHSHPYIDFPRPEMPKTIPIGGITLEKSASVNMTLPEEWDEILSVRETNILISFGTYAKTSDMPDEYKKNFISLFEKFPNTTFIWKYEDPEEELFQGIDNLVLTKWMPQVPLLADPRLSLFIMHGGIGSTIEVAHSGKPAVVIPIQGDQRRNAAALRKHKVALTLHKEDLGDKDKLIDAVVEVLGDEDYQKRAKRLSELLKNRPFSAKELVLKHCNLAAKFGPLVELDSYGKNLGAIRYYLIDVVLLLIFITLLTISLISLCCVYTCRKCKSFCSKGKTEPVAMTEQNQSLLQNEQNENSTEQKKNS